MKKRIVAMFLAVCFMISLLPTAAFATGTAQAGEYTVEVTAASTDAKKSAVQQAFEQQHPGVNFDDVTKLTVVAKNVKLETADFQFLSGVVVTGGDPAADGVTVTYPGKDEDGTEITYLKNMTELDLTDCDATTEIPARAFQNDTKIQVVFLPQYLKTIGRSAFNCDQSTKNYSSLTYVGTRDYKNSGKIVFPDTVEKIGQSAFWRVSGLTGELVLPESLNALGASAFENTGVSGSIKIKSNVVFEKTAGGAACRAVFAGTKISSLEFEEGITTIPEWFARECPLTKIVIPSTVETIGESAFFHDYNENVETLDGDLVIPSKVSEIKQSAFYHVGNVNNIIVENPDVNLVQGCFNYLNSKIYFTAKKENLANVSDRYWNESATILNTDGGKVTPNSTETYKSTGLYIPTKEGYTFEGWFEGDTELTSAAQAGHTYTAKWHKASTITTDIADKEFVVGQPTEFTLTVTANDDVDEVVSGGIGFAGENGQLTADDVTFESVIAKNSTTGEEIDLKSENGFAMQDATVTVRVTFKKKGNYKFMAVVGKKSASSTPLCTTGEIEFTVSNAKHSITVVDADGNTLGTLPNAEEDTTVELGNSFTGIPSGKKVESWTAKTPASLTIAKDETTGKYTFTMPTEDVTLVATLVDADPAEPVDPVEPEQPSTDDGAGTAVAVVLGGAAVGATAYLVGTQIWLETHMPDGVIPTSREQLALVLWNAAGKPQPASTALYADLSAEAVDSQLAARWCVEQGLLKDYGESFKPGDYTFRPQVIKAWNQVQNMINQ